MDVCNYHPFKRVVEHDLLRKKASAWFYIYCVCIIFVKALGLKQMLVKSERGGSNGQKIVQRLSSIYGPC